MGAAVHTGSRCSSHLCTHHRVCLLPHSATNTRSQRFPGGLGTLCPDRSRSRRFPCCQDTAVLAALARFLRPPHLGGVVPGCGLGSHTLHGIGACAGASAVPPFSTGSLFHLFRDRLQLACPLVPCVSQPLEPVRCACEYNGITRTPLCAHVHARLGVCQAFPSSMVLCAVHWPALPSLVHACARPGTQSQPISCASAPNHSVPAAGVGVLPCA